MRRTTRNSLESQYGLPATSTASSEASPAATINPNNVDASSQPSEEFILAVARAVRTVMATDQAASSSSPPAVATTMTTSTLPFVVPTVSASGLQGRSPVVAPTFLSTFAEIAPSTTGSTTPLTNVPIIPGLPASCTILNQPFVVGPGFSPIPAKYVTHILAGKYVDLSDLLPLNNALVEPEPQVFLDGRVLSISAPKKNKRQIDDIVSWMEAFSIYCLILASSFPQRWPDLMRYKLLILRTHRQFGGKVWLAYDKAFREHAAATKLTDWSTMEVQLYNFHSAGAPARSQMNRVEENFTEPEGSASSQICCKSWNRGRCSAPSAKCRFAHKCTGCLGAHRVSACSGSTSYPHRRSRSPTPTREGNKRRKR